MKNFKSINELKIKISDNSDKIKYLLNHVLDKLDNDKESFMFVTMAIDFAIAIKYYSQDIENFLEDKK